MLLDAGGVVRARGLVNTREHLESLFEADERGVGSVQEFLAREASGRREVFVGRLRQDPGDPRALLMWVVADNLLKGAAWNAVQIAARLAGTDAQ